MQKFLLRLTVLVFAVIGAGAVALVVLGGSNSNSPESSSGAGTPPDAQGTVVSDLSAADLLQQATLRAGEVSSFHFRLTHENGSTPLPLNLQLNTAEGDVLVPSSMKANVTATAAGIDVSVQVIGINDQTWITNPFTRNWQQLPNTNIRNFADPAALVSGLLPSIKGATVSDGGTLDGVKTRKVSGTIDSGALHAALGVAEAGHQIKVDVWIGTDDLLPRRLRLAGPLTAAESPNIVRQLDLSQYNEPLQIMPPG